MDGIESIISIIGIVGVLALLAGVVFVFGKRFSIGALIYNLFFKKK